MNEATESRRPRNIFIAVAVVAVLGTSMLADHEIQLVDGALYALKIFTHLFVRYDVPAAKMMALTFGLAALGGMLVTPEMVDRVLATVARHPVIFASVVGIAIAGIAPFVYQGYPLSLDEYSPVFQSRIFATGHVYGQYPPALAERLTPLPGEFISVSVSTGQTMEAQWPSWALILTPFTALGVPWLANAIVAVIVLLLLGRLTARLLPEEPLAPAWAMLLCAASPVFIADAVSFYTMNLHLLCTLAYALLFVEPTPRRLVGAGLIGALALSLNNPFPHLAVATPWILWMVFSKERIRRLPWLALGYLPIVPVGLEWLHLQSAIRVMPSASPTTSGVVGLTLRERLLEEFGNGAFAMPVGQIWTDHLVWALKLYLWAVPGLIVIAVWGFRHVRRSPVARLMVASAGTIIVGYMFVKFDQGHGWGVRYWHPVWGVLPLFGAAWLVRDPVGRQWRGFFFCLAMGSLILLAPERLVQMREFVAEAQTQSPPADPGKRQLIFVDTRLGTGRYFPWDAVRNDPFLRDPTTRIASHGRSEDAQLAQQLHPGAVEMSHDVHGSVWNLP